MSQLPRSRPYQVGVTGGIGSGKSVVCQVFSLLNVPVYLADERARWLTEHDPILKADVERVLGRDAYDVLGRYNRAWVAARVFADPDLLDQLNAVVHPRVGADTDTWLAGHRDRPYVVKEAALMRAAGDGNSLNWVVVVQAPLALRIERIRQRDPQRSVTEIENIIRRQMGDDERRKLADFVLDNDESRLLLPQIIQLHEFFCNFRA